MDKLIRQIRQILKERAKITDRMLREAIVGAKITDFKIEEIPRRKRMYLLIIKTDAKPVKDPFNKHVLFDISTIKLKIKI